MNNSLKMGARFLIRASLFAAILAVATIPASAYAAMYAYVNTSGEVSAVVANDPNTAIATAPNIATHSGVLLLNDQSDPIVGDGVSGI